MTKVLFLCHGNICRSPAAQYIFNKIIKDRSLDKKYVATSLALTTEEIGNDIYPPMKLALDKAGIKYAKHAARLVTAKDIDDADLVVYMDDENRRCLYDMFPSCNKAVCLAYYINKEDIDDPWFTRGFDGCVQDLQIAINKLIDDLEKR